MGALSKLSRIATPFIAVLALALAIHIWHIENLRKIRLDQVVELSIGINDAKRDTNTNIDSLRNVITQLQFEKQSYTSNLDLMSDWFLFSFTILFGIFFLVGYGVFDQKIQDNDKRNHDNYVSINERNAHFENEFKDLKYDVYGSIARLNYIDAFQNNDRISQGNREKIASLFFRMIEGIEYRLKAINVRPLSDGTNEKVKAAIKDGLSSINGVIKNLGTDDKVHFINYCTLEGVDDYDVVLKSINYISHNSDQETKILCAEFTYLINEILKEKKEAGKSV